MIDEKELALRGLAMRAGLVPCSSLPKPNPDKALEEFLFRVSVMVKSAAASGHMECKFRVNGIPNTPFHVMDAAIGPLEAFGYKARMRNELDTPESNEYTTYLIVSGWGD